MTLDLDAIVERASEWQGYAGENARSAFGEGYADMLAGYVLALAEEVRRLREATNGCLGTSRPGSHGPDSVDVIFTEEAWATLRDSALSREPAEKGAK
jgi:hypothetical protein